MRFASSSLQSPHTHVAVCIHAFFFLHSFRLCLNLGWVFFFVCSIHIFIQFIITIDARTVQICVDWPRHFFPLAYVHLNMVVSLHFSIFTLFVHLGNVAHFVIINLCALRPGLLFPPLRLLMWLYQLCHSFFFACCLGVQFVFFFSLCDRLVLFFVVMFDVDQTCLHATVNSHKIDFGG